MNRKLLDPFKSAALPEVIEEYLEYGIAKSCAFNRRGTLLATGTEDGYIIIWDFETRGMAKVLPGHSNPNTQDAPSKAQAAAVTSLAWSRNGRQLLSGSLDKRLILWDVLRSEEQTKVAEVVLPGTVNHLCLSPRQPYTAVASLLQTPPVLVDFSTQQVTPLPSIDFKDNKGQLDVIINSTATGFALLSKSGEEVFLGQLRGAITAYDKQTQQVLDVFRLPAPVKVMSMFLNRKGNILLVNCSDKVIRMLKVRPRAEGAKLYSHEELKAVLSSTEVGKTGSLLQDQQTSILQLSPITFQNAVEKDNQWRGAVTNQDDEHVAAIVNSKNDHRVYIWDQRWGKLVKILEGPGSDSAHDLAWHPTRSCLITLTSTGKVYIWSHIWDENWSSFAPDFYELDENVEYVEQEDEFDLNEKPAAATADAGAEEAADVDILTKEALYVFSSDEEDEGLSGVEAPLHWLPAEVTLKQGSAAGDGQEQQQAAEEQDESSEEGSDENEKQEPEILDGPRKRKVRFDITAAADDADLDEPPPPGAKPGRGRGRGRRGRPPRGAAAAAAAAGRAAAAAASGAAAYDGAGYNAGAYGGQDPGLSGRPVAYPGNMLPGPDAQGLDQQQMYGGWLPGGM